MAYLDIRPETGKWYVSAGWQHDTYGLRRNPEDEQKEKTRHNQRRDKMILAGPFDTQEEAEKAAEAIECPPAPHVWQR